MIIVMMAPVFLQVPPAPPSPPRYSPPPIVTIATPRAAVSQAESQRFQIGVRLRAPSGILWDSTLWVSRRAAGTWREERSEAPAPGCPAAWNFGRKSEETSVNLAITGDSDAVDPAFSIQVRWSRAAPGACGGIRTVEIRDLQPLAVGKLVRIEGDGGLVVELLRR